MGAVEFNQWVNDNNIDRKHPYSKGWWEHIDLIRRLAHHLGSDVQFVEGGLHITTPPPQTPMTLPVVRMEFGHAHATIAWFLSYSGFAPEYLVMFSGPCPKQPQAYQTFTATPGDLKWLLSKFAREPRNQHLLPCFDAGAGNCLFATHTEMDLYGALKSLLEPKKVNLF